MLPTDQVILSFIHWISFLRLLWRLEIELLEKRKSLTQKLGEFDSNLGCELIYIYISKQAF